MQILPHAQRNPAQRNPAQRNPALRMPVLRIPVLAAVLAAAGFAADAARPAQAETGLLFALRGNVREPASLPGYTGEVRVTCEADPAQTAAVVGPVGGVQRPTSVRLKCVGPVRVEGYVEKEGRRIACLPYLIRQPRYPQVNFAQFQSVVPSGTSVVCRMFGI